MSDSAIAAALALVKEHLGDAAVRELEIKIEDSDRIKVIRDAFLEGHDREAVTLMRDLVRWGDIHEGSFRFLPTSAGGSIAPGQSAMIAARPQTYAFRALALLVSEQSRRFLISDLRVGNRSQFVQSGDIPADVLTPIPAELEAVFAESTVEEARKIEVVMRADVLSRAIVPIDCEICLTAMELVIIVVNPTKEALPWRAVWLGKDVEPPASRRRMPVDPESDWSGIVGEPPE